MIDLNDHNVYMRAALAEAQVAAEAGEVPVGAVIVAAGRIIARSHNLTELLVDVTAHAEIQAITAASNYLGNKYLQKCTLYVTLEPCPMCAGALFWSQMGHVVYGASDEKRGYQKHGGPLHPKTKMTSGILADECAQLLTDFFANKRH
ncbi:nucleoside deaminase [Schleiferiaceae bacterium]|jgi:tRNA(adenine34) deaminase|nr:nucleoside deaminase [Bacteroidota bacterium]MDA7805310.1 nucleoside deaminase [Schleiferiaceae bacterium]MBT6365625.1 nucleoside deaminase [Bacteroidota bacterium]MDA8565728.1 nucleoside deaminase [Schleiferiaceae bacterium]MDA8825024.1 nucleoside deaminase [Schleiferiaceae bacterium]